MTSPLAPLSLLAALCVATCGGPGSPFVSGGGSISSASYLDEALDPDNLFRWTPVDSGKVVDVWFEVLNAPSELPVGLQGLGLGPDATADAVRRALNAWGAAVGVPLATHLAFHAEGQEVAAGHVAVVVSFVEGEGPLSGLVQLAYAGPDSRLVAQVPMVISVPPEGVTVSDLRALMLHEMGHALGILAPAPKNGHSSDPGDVMYPVARWQELSARDRVAMQELYAMEPNLLRADAGNAPGAPGDGGADDGEGAGGASSGGLALPDPRELLAAALERVAVASGDGPRCLGCAAER